MVVSTNLGSNYISYCPNETKQVDITLEPKSDISKKEFYKAVNKLISELELNWTLKEINANIEIK